MTTNSPVPVAPVTQAQKWMGRLVVVLVFLWILAVSFGAQALVWMAPALGLSGGPVSMAFATTLVQATAIALPLLLAAFWPVARYRAMYRTWLWAALLLLLLAPARLLPSVEQQLALVLQVGAVGIYLGLLVVLGRPLRGRDPAPAGLLVAVSTALAFALPWVAWGALGSPLDGLLALSLGLVTGLAISLSLSLDWLPSLAKDSRGPARDVLTGGFTLGVMLLIVASGLGSNGSQLLMMVALPSLGWVAMAVSLLGMGPAEAAQRGHNWMAAAVLMGGAAAAILLFVDSDGMLLIVSDSILLWAARAAGLSMLLGWGMSLLALLASRRLSGFEPGPGYALATVFLAAVAGLLYVGGGQSGSHGDRLFVILQDQADVSQAAKIVDYDQRRQYVYQRLTEHAETSQAGLRATLDRWGIAHTPYYLVNAVEVQGGLPLRLMLALRNDVDRVLPSPVLRPPQAGTGESLGSAPAPTGTPWNVTDVGADQVWRELGVTGQGIVVGQSDSGVQFDHPELADGYLGRDGQHDGAWLDPWHSTAAPSDPDGHGTHTLGSVLGNTVGVAPDASWIACANLPRNLGNPARYLDCLQFMLAPYAQGTNPFRDGDPTRSAHVLNNSWGCPQDVEGCDPGSLLPAVRALRAAGIYVVASAGNDGPACGSLTDPLAIYDESLSVGAVDMLGKLAAFSSRGPVVVDHSGRTKPDLVAPGVDILSAFPGGTYQVLSGTSMAGPHVAGVVALMWSANPNLIGDVAATDRILRESAADFQGDLGDALPNENPLGEALPLLPTGGSGTACGPLTEGPNNLAGYGVVDAYRAVQMALESVPAD